MNTMPLNKSPMAPDEDLAYQQQEARYLNRLTMLFLSVIIISWSIAILGKFQVGLSILIGFGLLTAIIGIRKPLVGLLGISILCALDTPSRVFLLTGGILRWNTLNYWLLVMLALNFGVLLKLGTIHAKFAFVFGIVLAIFLVLTPATGMEIGTMTVLNFFSYFGLLVYFARVARNPRIWYLQGLICGVLAAFGGLAYYLQQSELPYVNPNAWAYFPITAIFALCLGHKYAPSGWKGQIPIGILAVANFAWVFLSGSRGGLLVSSACILFLLLTMRSLSQRLVYVAMAAVLGFTAITEFSDLSETAIHRVTKLFDPNVKVESRTSGRSDLAVGAWYIFEENPFGVGTGGFSSAWVKLGYRDALSGFGYEKQVEAHSGWAKVLAENGVIGITLFTCFVVSFLVVGWKKRKQGFFPLGLLATVILALAFFSTDFASKGLWYVAAGATVLLSVKRPGPQKGPQ
jgi:hypothetical protein